MDTLHFAKRAQFHLSRRPQLRNREPRLKAAVDSAAKQLAFKLLRYSSQSALAAACLAAWQLQLSWQELKGTGSACVQLTTIDSSKQMIYAAYLDFLFWLFFFFGTLLSPNRVLCAWQWWALKLLSDPLFKNKRILLLNSDDSWFYAAYTFM